MAMSSGFSTSPMPVIELTAVAPSLMASLRDVRVRVDDARRHELAGAVVHRRARGIATLAPIAAILPSRSTMVPLLIVPARDTVTSVALRMATTPLWVVAA